MKILKAFFLGWTLFRILLHLLTGLILAHIFLRQGIHGSPSASRLFIWWNRHICQLFSAQINVKGSIQDTPTLFVMNHISWFDIPVLATQKPLHFLSKAEVKKWPLIGWLTQHAGTLFIQRGTAGAAEKSLDEISSCLKQGHSVVLFPEGTTSNGASLKKFHGRLLQAAIDAEVMIQPVALRYPYQQGINTHVPYIDDMSFMDSLMGLMHSSPLKVELTFLPAIDTHLNTTSNNLRNQLAQDARQAIADALDISL